jgi:hypothetical protein
MASRPQSLTISSPDAHSAAQACDAGRLRIEVVADELFRGVRPLVVGRRRAILEDSSVGTHVVRPGECSAAPWS